MGYMQRKCKQEKEKQKEYKAVIVKWVDPEFCGGWHSESDIHKDMEPITSIGYLIHHTVDMVVLSTTVNERKDDRIFADVAKFPIGCVLSITEIDMEE